MRKSVKLALVAVLVICAMACVGFATIQPQSVKADTQSTALIGAKVLKFSIDFGENFNQEGTKKAYVQFAKLQGADRFDFAEGDVISWQVYSPSIDAGGLDGQTFTPLAADPWATDWGWLRSETNISYCTSWAVSTVGQTDFVSRSSTVNAASSLIGKTTNFFSVCYETNAAMPVRNVDIYYKNVIIKDADGHIKGTLLNNASAYTFLTGYTDISEGMTATVSMVGDPFAAKLPVEADEKVLALSIDLGEDYAAASTKMASIIIASPANASPIIQEGDFIEYDVYCPNLQGGNFTFNAQESTGWAFLSDGGISFKELNQQVKATWATLAYKSTNGSVYAADFSSDWYTRYLVADKNSSLVGKAFYHVGLFYQTTAAATDRYVTVYVKNIRIRNVNNEITYCAFDGTQAANTILSSAQPEWSNNVSAAITVVDIPLSTPVFEREDRDAESKYINVKVLNGSATEKTYTGSIVALETPYTVAEGDKLVYSVSMAKAVKGMGSLDLCFGDGTKLSNGNYYDGYGFSAGANVALGDKALKNAYTNAWLLRTIDLTDFVGKELNGVNALVELNSDFAGDTAEVMFGSIAIVNGNSRVDLYGGEAVFNADNAVKVEGTLSGMVSEEPTLYPENAPEEYVTFTYSLDDKTEDVSRHFRLSFFGYAANSVVVEKGDRIFFDVSASVVGGGISLGEVDFQIEGGTWTTLSAQNITDQRGLQTEDMSFVGSADTWYTKYFDIETDTLNFPVAHWVLTAHIDGVQTFDEASVSIANLFILKPNGDKHYIIGNGNTVFEGSIDRFGTAEEYKSGMDIVGVDVTGHTPSAQAAPEKYIKVDYTIGGLSVGAVASRDLYLSLFGDYFTDYIFQEGDVLSYDINLSAPLAGIGMVDFQVINPTESATEYHGLFMRDLVKRGRNSGNLILDNNGTEYAANCDISSFAYGGWTTRTVKVPSEFNDYQLQHVVLVLSNSSWLQGYQFSDVQDDYLRKITVLLGNIKILHSDSTETVIFDGGDLKYFDDNKMVLTESGDVLYTVSNVPALVPPTAQSPEVSFEKLNQKDVSVTVDLKGKNFVSVTLEGAALTADDYALDGGALVIKKQFLAELENGDYVFVLSTDEGSCEFELTVENGTAVTSETSEAGGGCNVAMGDRSGLLMIVLLAFAAATVIAKKRFANKKGC